MKTRINLFGGFLQKLLLDSLRVFLCMGVLSRIVDQVDLNVPKYKIGLETGSK